MTVQDKENLDKFKSQIKIRDLETIMDKIVEMHDIIKVIKSNNENCIKSIDDSLKELMQKNDELFKEFQFKFYLNFEDDK